MKKIIICLSFSAALAAMTSCGRIEDEPAPDRTINMLTTSSTTTAVTSAKDNALTTTVKTESLKIKKLSFSGKDETEEKSVPQPVVTVPVSNGNGSKNSASGGTSGNSTSTSAKSVPDTAVTTTADPENSSGEFSRIAGEWKYQKRISENQFIIDGYVKIENDGSFELCIGNSGNTNHGKIKTKTERFIDGTEYLNYIFKGNNSKELLECHFMPDGSDILFVGNNEVSRFIREYDLLNNTGFGSIAGDWEYQERDRSTDGYKTVGTITIDEEGSFSYCSDSGSDKKSGTITLRSENYADGTEKYYYAFCEDGKNNIWKSCFCEQADPDIYYAGNGGDSRFVRMSEYKTAYDVSILANHWEYQKVSIHDDSVPEYVTVGYLDIEDDGHYTYTSLDGDENRYGMIRQECDDDGFQIFAFYDYGQDYWTCCYCDQQDYDRIFMDKDIFTRIRCYDREKSLSERFIGTWGKDRFVALITQYNDIFVVDITGYENDTEICWRYNCEYDEKEDMLVCNGKGKKEHLVIMGSEEENIWTYALLSDNCSAKFRFEGDNIIWDNITENKTAKYAPVEAFG